MLTLRQLKIRRALLKSAANMPEGILLPDAELRADAGRLVSPPPLVSELDEQINAAQGARQLFGQPTDEGTKWQLTDAGRAWLAQHP